MMVFCFSCFGNRSILKLPLRGHLSDVWILDKNLQIFNISNYMKHAVYKYIIKMVFDCIIFFYSQYYQSVDIMVIIIVLSIRLYWTLLDKVTVMARLKMLVFKTVHVHLNGMFMVQPRNFLSSKLKVILIDSWWMACNNEVRSTSWIGSKL